MLAQNPSLGEQYFVNSFLSGLKEEIYNTVYLYKPTTLKDARDKARAHECVVEALEKKGKGGSRQLVTSAINTSKNWPSKSNELYKPSFYNNMVTDKQTTKGIRRLPYSEFKEKMSKRLCIHCDEKYTW